jgi:tRNA threonylcarbamoyladenosine biosynthesis protein TsaB
VVTPQGSATGITLAVDASMYEGSVAVLRDGALVAERTVAMRGETEERLMPAVIDALREIGASPSDVARVVCGEGPGSFTSLRIAGSIAKGLAFGNDVPLYAVSSLALIVAGARDLVPGRYLAVLDAMRGERYVLPLTVDARGMIVAAGGDGQGSDQSGMRNSMRVPATELPALATKLGARPIGPLESPATPPHARGAARLIASVLAAGPVSLDSWEPIYGRLAEAQVKWEAAHGRPLSA